MGCQEGIITYTNGGVWLAGHGRLYCRFWNLKSPIPGETAAQ